MLEFTIIVARFAWTLVLVFSYQNYVTSSDAIKAVCFTTHWFTPYFWSKIWKSKSVENGSWKNRIGVNKRFYPNLITFQIKTLDEHWYASVTPFSFPLLWDISKLWVWIIEIIKKNENYREGITEIEWRCVWGNTQNCRQKRTKSIARDKYEF